MKNLSYLFFAIAIISFSSCTQKIKTPISTINGELSNTIPGKTIYLYEMTPKKNILMDSCAIVNSKFSFTLKNIEPGFYNLTLTPDNYITLLVDTNETIVFKGNMNRIYFNYKVDGSKGSLILKEFNDNRQKAYLKIDSLKTLMQEKQIAENYSVIKASIDSTFEKIFEQEKDFTLKFILKNQSSLASIIALFQPLGIKYLFTPEDNFDLFIKTDSLLSSKYPKSKHTEALHKEVAKSLKARNEWRNLLDKIKAGRIAPEIRLTDIKGKTSSLKDYSKMPVLIYFWASWDKTSRISNTIINELYKKYKKQNLVIYGISLDKDATSIEDAVKTDEIKWNTYKDYASLQSEYAKTYNVKDLPSFFLLDTANVIVNRYNSVEKLKLATDSLMKKYEK
ncbi:MAG: TlpA disulfide reductase family protein [Bacteroidota bacterium]